MKKHQVEETAVKTASELSHYKKVAAAAVALTLVAGGMTTYAATDEDRQANKEAREAQRAAMEQTLEDGDFEAWKSLVEEQQAEMEAKHTEKEANYEVMTSEESFAVIKEAKALADAGDTSAAKTLLEESDLRAPGIFDANGKRGMKGDGFRGKELTEEQQAEMEEKRAEMEAHHEAVEAAIDSGNYDTWKSLMDEHHAEREAERAEKQAEVADQITEENFEVLQEAHELAESGDREGARELLEENDLKPMGPGIGKKGGRGHGPRGERGQHMSPDSDEMPSGDQEA